MTPKEVRVLKPGDSVADYRGREVCVREVRTKGRKVTVVAENDTTEYSCSELRLATLGDRRVWEHERAVAAEAAAFRAEVRAVGQFFRTDRIFPRCAAGKYALGPDDDYEVHLNRAQIRAHLVTMQASMRSALTMIAMTAQAGGDVSSAIESALDATVPKVGKWPRSDSTSRSLHAALTAFGPAVVAEFDRQAGWP